MKIPAIFVAFAFTLAACQVSPSHASDPSSYVWTPTRWPDPRKVPVCIMNASEVSEDLIRDLRTHVTFEYGYHAGIGLVGWTPCAAQDAGVAKIRLYFNRFHDWSGMKVQSGGGLSLVGQGSISCGADCRGGTMRVDVGRDAQYPPLNHPLRDFVVSQTRAAALHEFGHALGLMHEHERSDAPRCNDMQGIGANNDKTVFVGNYDPNSIMNYCKDEKLTNLSPGDLEGLKYLYPGLQ